MISTHSLTRRLTDGNVDVMICLNISTHSLTRRLTVSPRSTLSLLSYFNSQPHKEADVPASKCFFQKVISTHSLTRRLTGSLSVIGNTIKYFNSQPHKEADRNFRQKHIYPKLIFLLIIHISLIFYSNHHILNYFSCKLYVFPGANVLEYFCELTFRTIILRYL